MKERIKVVRIIDRLNIGGPAIHVALLSAKLNPDKFETLLVAGEVGEFEGDMGYLSRQYGVEPIFLRGLQREISLWRDFSVLWRLFQFFVSEKPDIVHTHKSKAGVVGRVAAVFARVPVIVHTFHGHVFHNYFGKVKTAMFLLVERILAHFTDKIIAISEHQCRELCRRYRLAASSRFAVVPLGFDFSRLEKWPHCCGKLRRRCGISSRQPVVGIVGRLTAIKNHHLFLEAAKKILERKKDVHFVVVGDGELRSQLERQASLLGISPAVCFTGWIRDPAVIYADLDIVALTSLNEGTPVALIEAMYCRKPVVATAVGGVGDVVEDRQHGLLVRSGDAVQFAGAVSALLEDPEKRQQLGSRGYQKVKTFYSYQRLTADVEGLYLKLLQKRHRK